jgi:hypothetical protein
MFDGIKRRARYLLRFREPWHLGGPDARELLPHELACRDEELTWLMRHHGSYWKLINGQIAGKGVPTNTTGTYAGPGAFANAQAGAAVTGGTTNVAWWSPATYSPIPANSVKAPAAFRLKAGGLVTSSGAGQTITLNPAIGTAVAGQALGASSVHVLGSTITGAFWRLEYELLIRTTGTSGTAVGTADFMWTTTAGASPATPTATNPSSALFGGFNTVATADFQGTAQGLLIAATPSAAGVSVTPNGIIFQSLD